ncbi:MAG TPA: hypothetical protein ENK06_04105 [Gammaproteobacteria bacterium]|nr:hypothetical protein [Gammaproteobacteria bacterium]
MDRSILYFLLTGATVGLILNGFVGNPWLGLGIGVVIGLLAWLLRGRLGKRTISGLKGNVYQELLSKAHGDKSLVERLIGYEQKRNPDGVRQDWVADALDRWERDRG